MECFIRMKASTAIGLLVLVEIVTVGLGMGVPIFAIIAGFAIGVWGALRCRCRPTTSKRMKGALLPGFLGSMMTLIMMAVIWVPMFRLLGDPKFDAAEWGIPLVLYTSTASFLGWQALMLVISPLLQFMASATASSLVFAFAAEKPEEPLEADAYRGPGSGGAAGID